MKGDRGLNQSSEKELFLSKRLTAKLFEGLVGFEECLLIEFLKASKEKYCDYA